MTDQQLLTGQRLLDWLKSLNAEQLAMSVLVHRDKSNEYYRVFDTDISLESELTTEGHPVIIIIR